MAIPAHHCILDILNNHSTETHVTHYSTNANTLAALADSTTSHPVPKPTLHHHRFHHFPTKVIVLSSPLQPSSPLFHNALTHMAIQSLQMAKTQWNDGNDHSLHGIIDCEDPDWLLSCNLQRKARMDGLDQELLG